jgi:hypothetical protein
MFVTEVFLSEFNSSTQSLEFKPSWGGFNCTNSVSRLSTDSVVLKPGDTCTSIDPDGRKMLFVGLCLGTAVLYEEEPNKKRSTIRMTETFDELKMKGIGKVLTVDDLLMIFHENDPIIN